MTARTLRIRRWSYDRPAKRGPLTLALHRNPRDMTGARTKVAAHSGVLEHLARTTRQNARKGGVVFAAHELFRVESLLRAFRRELLETPLEVRGSAHSGALFMTELTIQRAALSRRTSRPIGRSHRILGWSRPGLAVATKQERTISRSVADAQLSPLAVGELVREREGERRASGRARAAAVRAARGARR